MVVVARCESKLAGLLVSQSIFKREGRAEFTRVRRKLHKLKRRKPEVHDFLMCEFLAVLRRFEKEILTV